MRYRYNESDWDVMLHEEIADEIVNLDKAHKRAKRALRQQQKAIDERNKIIGKLLNKNDELDSILHDLEMKVEELTSENEDLYNKLDMYIEDNEGLSLENEDISQSSYKLIAENDELQEEVNYWRKRFYHQLERTKELEWCLGNDEEEEVLYND